MVKVNFGSAKEKKIKIGDILVVEGTTLTNRHAKMFIQLIDVSGKLQFLNIESGYCIQNSINLRSTAVEELLLDSIKANWKAWKVIDIVCGDEIELNLHKIY